MSMGKEFYSTIVRRRPVLVDTIFHQWQIEIDSRQSRWARAKPGLCSQAILEMGRVTRVTSPVQLCCATMSSWIFPTALSLSHRYYILLSSRIKYTCHGEMWQTCTKHGKHRIVCRLSVGKFEGIFFFKKKNVCT
jgi:hypothetical protein